MASLLETAAAAPVSIRFDNTFAVSRLRKWQDEGADVSACVPHLAVYLGHAAIEDTYWYLTATPELLNTASHLFAVHVGGEGAQ